MYCNFRALPFLVGRGVPFGVRAWLYLLEVLKMLEVTQLGFVGALPELRFVATDNAVATVRVCTTDRWKDDAGATQERSTWLTWECWGKSAENLAKLVDKGAQILLRGSIRNESWTDKDGKTRYRDKYVVSRWQLLGRKTESGVELDEDGGSGVVVDDSDVPF